MTHWEYLAIQGNYYLTHSNQYESIGTPHVDGVNLNKLGAQGWEVVGFTPYSPPSKERISGSCYVKVLLKRPLQES